MKSNGHLAKVRQFELEKQRRKRCPSETFTISSDEGEENNKDVYIVEESHTSIEPKIEPEKEEKAKHKEYLKAAADLVRGKETEKGIYCRVCQNHYRNFKAHLKTVKHNEAFEKSKFFAQLQKSVNQNVNQQKRKVGNAVVYKESDKVIKENVQQTSSIKQGGQEKLKKYKKASHNVSGKLI